MQLVKNMDEKVFKDMDVRDEVSALHCQEYCRTFHALSALFCFAEVFPEHLAQF